MSQKYNAEESETQRRRVEAKFDNEIVSDTADGEAKEGRGKARPTTMSRPEGGGRERPIESAAVVKRER